MHQRRESAEATTKAFGLATRFIEESKTGKKPEPKIEKDQPSSKQKKEKIKQKRTKSRQPSQKKKKGNDSSGNITDEDMPGEGYAYRPVSRNGSDFTMAKKSLGAFSTSRIESTNNSMTVATTWASASVLMPSSGTLFSDRSPTGSQTSTKLKVTREASKDQE